MTWCWYVEGGSFHGGFATRADAIRAARDSEEDIARIYIGTVSGPIEEMCRVIDARDIADNLEEHLNVEGCRVRIATGAQEALRAWVREYLDFDANEVCLDGDKPTRDEWEEAGR